MRRIGRTLLAPLRSGALLGAAYLLAITRWSLARPVAGAEATLLGERARAVATLLDARDARAAHETELAVYGAALALGAVLGVAAGSLARASDHLARRGPRAWPRLALASACGAALLHAWLVAWSMATTPALYAPWFYDRGGALRALEVVVTDAFGPRGVIGAGAAAVALYLAGPIDTWRFWPGRLRRAFGPAFVPRRRRGSAAAPVLLAVAGLALAGLAVADVARAAPPAAVAAASPAHPNVLVLVVEGLEAGTVSPRVMPQVAAWAERAPGTVRFVHASAASPRALPAFVDLLTGRWPHHHGVRDAFVSREVLGRDLDALPARLAREGYDTALVADDAGDVSDPVDLRFGDAPAVASEPTEVARERVLARAMPLFPLLRTSIARRAVPATRRLAVAADVDLLAGEVVDALQRHATRGPGRPLFLTALFGAPPSYGRFVDRSYRGRYKYAAPRDAADEGSDADAADREQIEALRDGAAAAVDGACETIFEALVARGIEQSTVVVLVGAGGEGAGPGARVPLVVRDPRARAARPGAGTAIEAIVRDVDVAPTLYALAGVAPPPDLDGRSLAPAFDGRPLDPVLAFGESSDAVVETRLERDASRRGAVVLAAGATSELAFARRRAVRDAQHELVYAPTREGARYELFDVGARPSARRDLGAELPGEEARLRTELEAWMLGDPATALGPRGLVVARDEAVP